MFSVIIPTWNRKDDLADAVDSVLKQKGAEFEIIVVDNGSRDGTQDYCRELAAREARLRYVRFDENRGITIAENAGLAQAKGDVVFCLDDDEFIEEEDFLQKAQRLDKEWDILNVGIVNARTQRWEHFIFSQRRKTNLHKSFYVNNFGNGTVFIKRKVIEKIGLFEEAYFRQGHENEYAIRAILNGFNILYYPQLVLRHKVNPFRPGDRESSYYVLRNTLLKNYKYFTGFRLFALQAWQLAQFGLRLFAGKTSPRRIGKALKDYTAFKKSTTRILDYDPAAMERYFFVSRKVATSPEDIGRLGFLRYYVLGMTRFF